MPSAELFDSLQTFLAIEPDDYALLARYRQVLVDPADLSRAFYAYLTRHQDTRALLAPHVPQLDSLIGRQMQHIDSMFGAEPPKAAMVEEIVRLGYMHERIGVSSVWVAGAYELYLQHAEERLGASDLEDGLRGRLLRAIRKRVTLDLLLQLSGSRAAFADDIHRQNRQLTRLGRMYRALGRLSELAESQTSETALFDEVCRVSVEDAGFLFCRVGLLGFDGQLDYVATASHVPLDSFGAAAIRELQSLSFTADDQSPTARLIASGEAQIVNDVDADPGLDPWRAALATFQVRSMMVAPLLREGRVIGTMNFYAGEPGVFGNEERLFAESLTREISLSIEHIQALKSRSKIKAMLDYQTRFDTQLNVLNRQAIEIETDKLLILPSSERISATCVHLANIQQINQRVGTIVTDTVMAEAGLRLKSVLAGEGVLGRFDSDTFVVVSDRPGLTETLEATLEQLMHALRQPMRVLEHSIEIEPRLGVSCIAKGEADARDLFWQAEVALRETLRETARPCHIYDPSMRTRFQLRNTIQNDFAATLARGGEGLMLYYQPKVDLLSGEVVGFEALVRWQHEGMVRAPGYFLPVVEETRLMPALDWWVVQTAARQLAAWNAIGLRTCVAVNLSADAFEQDGFPQRIVGCLHQHGVKPSQLEIEILESVSLRHLERYGQSLQECCELGLSLALALDDFGTGASTLMHLQNVPADTIKIDQSFVRRLIEEPGNGAIIASMVSYSNFTNRQLVMEGVENDAIRTRLIELGCKVGQGYGIARPMPAADVPAWIGSWQAAEVVPAAD